MVYFDYTRCLYKKDLDVEKLHGICVDVDELNGFTLYE